MTTRWGADWRKLYRRPSQEWLALPLSARGMGDELVRVAADDGRVFVGADLVSGLMRALDAHAGERRRVRDALRALIAIGFCEIRGPYLCVAGFEQHLGCEAAELARLRAEASRRYRATVMARDGGQCVYCGSSGDLTLDHVVPLTRGGSNDLANLSAACRRCNSSKSDRTPDEWRGRPS